MGSADDPARRCPDQRTNERALGWAHAIHRLIHAGHRLPDVLDYTLAQMTAFLDAEMHRDREHDSLLLGVTAVASQGDKRSIERLQRELDRED
ncbi:MAG TPA: hypothetical protein ACQGQH_06065 [Xylella sp.]